MTIVLIPMSGTTNTLAFSYYLLICVNLRPVIIPPLFPTNHRAKRCKSRGRGRNVLRIKVLILVIKLIILAFTLASPPAPAPNAGSVAEEADHPIRARKRSSERMAMALIRSTAAGTRRQSGVLEGSEKRRWGI